MIPVAREDEIAMRPAPHRLLNADERRLLLAGWYRIIGYRETAEHDETKRVMPHVALSPSPFEPAPPVTASALERVGNVLLLVIAVLFAIVAIRLLGMVIFG